MSELSTIIEERQSRLVELIRKSYDAGTDAIPLVRDAAKAVYDKIDELNKTIDELDKTGDGCSVVRFFTSMLPL